MSDASGLGLYASEDTPAHDYKDKLPGLELEKGLGLGFQGLGLGFNLRVRV